jgi:hypothetical protein
MAYTIIRTAKLKSFQSIGIVHSHNTRQEATRENVDESRSELNTYSQFIGENAVDGVKSRLEELGITPRRNAVLAVEYVVSASPEFFDQSKNNYSVDSYFSEALKFIKDKHGLENIVSYCVHKDEQTPHAHIVVVPVDKNKKLNCREFLGGAEKLRKLQDDFYEAMKHTSRGVQLERGKKKGIGEAEKYIAKTSHVLGDLRRETSILLSSIEKETKSLQNALKEANIELAKAISLDLETKTEKLKELQQKTEDSKKLFEKEQPKPKPPKPQKGMEM